MRAKDAPPMLEMSCSIGECEKSGPLGVIGANAIAAAISIPPHAMKGMAYDTPVNKCCRSFCALSYTETLFIEYGAWNVRLQASCAVDKKHCLYYCDIL